VRHEKKSLLSGERENSKANGMGWCEAHRSSKVHRSVARMTHPFVVENGDLFSSADNLLTADAPADDELQDCVAAVAPTTF
jgi:hypothetical protein